MLEIIENDFVICTLIITIDVWEKREIFFHDRALKQLFYGISRIS